MFPVNCYLLYDETKEAVVIDAGCFFPEEKEHLKDCIESNGLILRHVLNTHLHLDHVFGNPFLFKEYGLRPEASREDEFWLAQASSMARSFGFMYDEKQPALGRYLQEGDVITFGNSELKVIHVPGHSPGSLVYYNEKDARLFSGDVLFEGSIGRADLQGGNFEELCEGIRNKLFVLPDDTRVCPGHGRYTSIEYEKRNNPFFR